MIYRPQQKTGEGKSSERGEAGVPYNRSPEGFWTRKQKPNINRVMGDADLPLAGRDRDCDAEENFSYGRDGYSKPKDKTTKEPTKSSTIWDEEAWKEKG